MLLLMYMYNRLIWWLCCWWWWSSAAFRGNLWIVRTFPLYTLFAIFYAGFSCVLAMPWCRSDQPVLVFVFRVILRHVRRVLRLDGRARDSLRAWTQYSREDEKDEQTVRTPFVREALKLKVRRTLWWCSPIRMMKNEKLLSKDPRLLPAFRKTTTTTT